MKVRQLNHDDYFKNYLELIQQLSNETYDITFDQFIDQLTKILYNQNNEIYVIEDNNRIIASGTILIENKFIHNCGKAAHIEDIVVDKKCRGKGLGKIMINHLTNIAKERGCYKVILDCDESNEKFYEKLGYQHKNIQMAIYFK